MALSLWGRGKVVPPGTETEKIDVSCGASQDTGSPPQTQDREDRLRDWLTARAP